MKAFLAGIAILVVLALATGIAYDHLAVDSAEGYAGNPSVRLDRPG